jgi:zinc protease
MTCPRRVALAGAAILGAILVVTLAVLSKNGLDSSRRGNDLAALEQPIASELSYTLDSLPNGLRYYVCAHASSDERTELRLVVDAGSVQETPDQRGLAHAVEHMVFRGTRTFPHGAIDRYFDAIGMRRGDDVNATTYMDDTRYRMSVPTDRAGAVDTALAMLASIAKEASFDSADARREAGVLFEEWRSSRDADARVVDARDSLLYAGTAYADRQVVGDTGVLRLFDLRAMRNYYETWYRPELMAVVVVGDFDADKVEAMVKRRFASSVAHGPRRSRPTRPVAIVSRSLRASVVADAEAQTSWISVWHPESRERYITRADYRVAAIAWLWREILGGRLEDDALDAASPLAFVDFDRRVMTRSVTADVVSVTAMKGQTLPALDVTVAEINELANGGPTATEVEEHARGIVRRAREQAQDGDRNAALAGEFVDHFLTGNAVFTNRIAYELARDILPTITVEDIRRFAHTRAADSGNVIVVAATSDDTAATLPPDAVVARVRSAHGTRRPQSGEDLDVTRLLATRPTSGRIVSERAIPEVHAYDWTLSNGMRVLVKPTSFTFDEIRLRAVAPGGASLASDETYASAYLADAIIQETGVGSIPAPRLRRWLGATSIAITPSVTDEAISLDGTTAPRDVDAFFQLLHLYLTSPRRDTVAFRRYQARVASVAQDRGRDPDAVFRDSVVAAFAGGSPRAMKRGASFYRKARLDDALDFWTHRTANGAGFTVAVVGDFTLARIRPLVERYLASIPRGVAEPPPDRRGATIPGGVHRDVTSGIVDRARTAIGFSAPFELSTSALNALALVREVLARTLRERLRDEMGGTYDVEVSLDFDEMPSPRYTMKIEFESAPSRVDALTAVAIDELKALHRSGPTALQFSGAREARVRDFDGRIEDNSYWVAELTFHALHGWSLGGIPAHRREIESMSLGDVRQACATYIPGGSYVRLTMRPDPRSRASAARR